MAVSDEVIIIAIGFIINYLIIYRSSKLLGNIGFFVIGFTILGLGSGAIFSAIGLLILIGSALKLVFDVADAWIKPRKG